MTTGDGDGVYDCVDRCPGEPGTDTDGEGTPDCKDGCPANPLRDDCSHWNCAYSPDDCNYVLISCDGVSQPQCLRYCYDDPAHYPDPCDCSVYVPDAGASSAQLLAFSAVTPTLSSLLQGAGSATTGVATRRALPPLGAGAGQWSTPFPTLAFGTLRASLAQPAPQGCAVFSAASPGLEHVDGADHGPVTVYGLTTCSWYAKTTALLDEMGIAYDRISMDRLEPDERAAVTEEIGRRTMSRWVPVTVIGDETIVGFKEAAIREALA
ncbi:MAG: glutaredoxin family protein [Methanospirillum sp.]|nr:glutaredoxin family protein [Methanospirillum sp.]